MDADRHYVFMATLGTLNLGFYAFGMPMLVGYVLYKRRHHLSRVENLAKFGFLTMGYEPGEAAVHSTPQLYTENKAFRAVPFVRTPYPSTVFATCDA